MTAANPVPMSKISTHKSKPYHRNLYPRHQWGKPRKGKVKCKICKLEIVKEYKIFNSYCRVKHDWQKAKPTHHKLTCANCGIRAWGRDIHKYIFCSVEAIKRKRADMNKTDY